MENKKFMPTRMCFVCRTRMGQHELNRLKIENNHIVRFNNIGRSFYICDICVENDKTKNHLKKIVKTGDLKEQFEEMRRLCRQ